MTNEQFTVIGGQAGRASFGTEPTHPRDNVTWAEARDFCTLRDARLPTEREWEYAARGPSNLLFPWGNGLDQTKFVWSTNSNNHSQDVGSRPEGQSWVGAQDMAGNVWELMSSAYAPYPYDAADGRETDRPNAAHVIRSGGWDNFFDGDFEAPARKSTADSDAPRTTVIGFRCARSV